MDIGITKRISKIALLSFLFIGILFEAIAQKGEISKSDTSCYTVVSNEAPQLKDIKIIKEVEKSKYELDFLEVYDFGDYQLNHEYVRLFYSDSKWFFESSQKSARIVNAESMNDLKVLANKIKKGQHAIYLCASSGSRKSSKYIFSIGGKMVNTLVTNTELADVKENQKVQEEKDLFTKFISEVKRLNSAP